MHVTTINNLPMFSDISFDEMKYLIEKSKKRFYPVGSIVTYEGDNPEFLYLILRGRVKVVLYQSNGRETILRTLKVGDYFGEMSVFDHLTGPFTVVTEEDSKFLVISHERFAGIVMRNPSIAMRIIRDMSMRLREANEMIGILSHSRVKVKVAKMLLKIANSEGRKLKDGCVHIPRPPLKDFASMLGSSRETVSRILNIFSKKGYLELSRQKIVINRIADLVYEAEEID